MSHLLIFLRFSLLITALISLIISQLPTWLDVNQYRAPIAALLSEYLQTPVRLKAIQISWHGIEPVLHLQDVHIADPKQQQPQSVQIARLTVRLHWSQSWQQRRWVIDRVVLHDLNVAIDPAGLAPLQAQPSPLLSWTEVMEWLLALPTLEVQVTELQIRGADKQVWVYSQRAELQVKQSRPKQPNADQNPDQRSHQNSHQITLQLRTIHPPITAKLSATVTGQADQPATWQAQLAFNGHVLSWQEVWRALQHSGFMEADRAASRRWLTPLWEVLPPRADLAFTGLWRGVGWEQVTGTVHLGLPPQATTVSTPPTWRLDLALTRTTDGTDGIHWQGHLHRQWPTWQQRTLATHPPDRRVATFTGHWPHPRLQVHVPDLAVDDLVQAIKPALAPDHQQRLMAWAPRGQVTATGHFDVETAHYRFDLGIKEGFTAAVDDFPGIEHLTAQIGVEPQRVQIQDAQATIHADPLFPQPLPFQHVTGEFTWSAEESPPPSSLPLIQIPHLELVMAGLPIALQGTVRLSDDQKSPYSDVRIRSQKIAVSQVINTLPTEIMNPHLVRWLQEALQAGQMTEGHALLRGHLADFPFDNGRGLFEARLRLRDVTLDYAPPWPALTQMDADLLFKNNGLQVTSQHGILFKTQLHQLTAQIADFDSGPLTVQGQLHGDGKTFLQFIREGPLSDRLNDYVADVEMHGQQALNLHLTLPLSFAAHDIAVQGALHFQGDTVRVLPLGLDLTDVQGSLQFTESTVQAREVALRVFDAPARFSITSHSDPRATVTDFQLRGRFDPWRLIGGPPRWWKPLSDGESHWNVKLRHENPLDKTEPSHIIVDLASDLQGLTLHLPSPLGKPATDQRELHVQAWPVSTPLTRRLPSQPPDPLWQVAVDYGPALQAQLAVQRDADQTFTVHRGELRIQAGEAHLPPEAGLHVVAHWDHVDTQGWERLFQAIFPNAHAALGTAAGSSAAPTFSDPTPSASTAPSLLRRIEAQLRQVRLGDQTFANVTVLMNLQHAQWVTDLSGPAIQGRVIAPMLPTATQPIVLDLSRLALQREDETTDAVAHTVRHEDRNDGDPRQVPPLDLTVQHLYLNDQRLGHLQARVRPHANGIQAQMTMQTADDHLAATVQWQQQGRTSQTAWDARLTSRHPAALLERLGYSLGIQNDAATLEATLAWPGSPLSPPTGIEGTLNLVMEQGRLLEVEPGMSGRVVGLLNLGALTRRLQLDFSDLSKPGMAFDRIAGHFRARQESLYTDDFALIGPSAQIHFNGRIGLTARDYDLTMTVTLPLTAPLGIAGAIAGGPVVGAAIWAVGEVLRPSINEITQMQYAVTGSWEEPSVVPIQPAAADPAADLHR